MSGDLTDEEPASGGAQGTGSSKVQSGGLSVIYQRDSKEASGQGYGHPAGGQEPGLHPQPRAWML